MPQTVPKRPTNGAVEPTVASTERPPCKLLLTSSTARFIDNETQVDKSICSSNVPSWCSLAAAPRSAMYQNGVPALSWMRPLAIVGAVQNFWLAMAACLNSFDCSISLVIMMYQVPADIMSIRIRTKRATKSPPFQSASRPYGLVTVSCSAAGAGVAGATGATALLSGDPADVAAEDKSSA